MMRVILMFVLVMGVVASGAWAEDAGTPKPAPATSTPAKDPKDPGKTPADVVKDGVDAATDLTQQGVEKGIDVVLSLFPDFLGRRIVLESIQKIADAIEDRLARANTVFYQGSAGFIVIFVAVYILYQAAKMLFPFFPLDRVSTALNASLTRILLAVTVTMFTASAMGPWNNLVAPVMVSGINYASELLFT
ncbi:MAG: hypothetical protein ACKO57_03500, partial [Alphaproteobacteria bacterium]